VELVFRPPGTAPNYFREHEVKTKLQLKTSTQKPKPNKEQKAEVTKSSRTCAKPHVGRSIV